MHKFYSVPVLLSRVCVCVCVCVALLALITSYIRAELRIYINSVVRQQQISGQTIYHLSRSVICYILSANRQSAKV